MRGELPRAVPVVALNTENIMQPGDFVKVNIDGESRPGQDGMVVDHGSDGEVGLVFGFARYNQPIAGVPSVGAESWHVTELNLRSVER